MEKIKYLALLRGINVGGKNIIKMDELKKIFEGMKFTDVKTYIQSGNVIFLDYENDQIKIQKKIERSLFKKLNGNNTLKYTLLFLIDVNILYIFKILYQPIVFLT